MQKQGYKLLSNFLNTMIGKVTYNVKLSMRKSNIKRGMAQIEVNIIN